MMKLKGQFLTLCAQTCVESVLMRFKFDYCCIKHSIQTVFFLPAWKRLFNYSMEVCYVFINEQ